MVASDEPSARLMLFCRSFLRAAEIAATPSGSRINKATSTPAKAGGAPMPAIPISTTSENFLASSTTASSETSSSAMLSASIRFDSCASPAASPPASLMK